VVSFDTGSSWVEIARAAMIAEVPLGTVVPYAALTLPTDGRWSWADGGLLSTSTYAAYYAIVGHAYNGGVDPGGGNFRKPDKRGRVMVGADNMGQGAAGRLPNSPRAVGQNGGVERHPLALGELAVHLHADGTLGAVAVGDHTHGPEAGFPWATVWPGDVADGDHPGSGIAVSLHQSATTAGAGGHGHDVSGSTANSGSGTAHQNLQPYEIDNVIVRVK
jgi:microcystin-dependent protein